MQIFKNKNKLLYLSLIWTFVILYFSTAFVSWYHSITFFNTANPVWLSVILSFVAEIGQASVLIAILLTKNKNKLLPWFIMIILTTLQIIGNVVSSYKFIATSTSLDYLYFQKSILFWVEDTNSETFKIIISWISGGILPIVALSMTALVADNIKLAEETNNETKEKTIEIEVKKSNNETITEFEPSINNDSINNETNELIDLQGTSIAEGGSSFNLNADSSTNIDKIPIIEEPKNNVESIVEKIKELKDKHDKNVTPVNKIPGWHLMKEFVDSAGNIFNKGKFVKRDKKKKPTQIKKV
jgi:hypothetical protein